MLPVVDVVFDHRNVHSVGSLCTLPIPDSVDRVTDATEDECTLGDDLKLLTRRQLERSKQPRKKYIEKTVPIASLNSIATIPETTPTPVPIYVPIRNGLRSGISTVCSID